MYRVTKWENYYYVQKWFPRSWLWGFFYAAGWWNLCGVSDDGAHYWWGWRDTEEYKTSKREVAVYKMTQVQAFEMPLLRKGPDA